LDIVKNVKLHFHKKTSRIKRIKWHCQSLLYADQGYKLLLKIHGVPKSRCAI